MTPLASQTLVMPTLVMIVPARLLIGFHLTRSWPSVGVRTSLAGL